MCKVLTSALLTVLSFLRLTQTHSERRQSEVSSLRPQVTVRIRLISDYEHFTLLRIIVLSRWQLLLLSLTLMATSSKMKVTYKEWFTALQDRPFSIVIGTNVSVLAWSLCLRLKEEKITKRRQIAIIRHRLLLFQHLPLSLMSIDVASLEFTKWPMAQLLHCLSFSLTPSFAHKWHKQWAIIRCRNSTLCSMWPQSAFLSV